MNPQEAFALPPVRTRDLLFGSGPRMARDAMGPMLVFYLGWRLAGLVVGILAATALSLAALVHEQRQGRRGLMARIALGFVVLQALVGLMTGSERLYLAQPVLITGGYGLAFLGSVLIRRPLGAGFAEEMYPFPEEVRRSITYRRAFSRISLIWGFYLIGRSVLRLIALSGSTVEAFLAVNIVTGVPLTTLLLGWSIWYGVRFFRRSEEWGEAIRMLDPLPTSGAYGNP
jgi:intracellular septation protein A